MKRTSAGLIATSFRTLGDVAVIRPRSLDEAVAALTRDAVPPAILAGGTDLVARFNEGFDPRRVLALAGLDELREIRADAGRLRIGALVTHAAGSTHDAVRRLLPGFAAAWARIANVRVRFTATIGGNLMARRTRYEMPVLLAALGGAIAVRDGGVARVWDATAYLAREPVARELLTHVEIPLGGPLAFDYERSLRPTMTQALAVRRSGDLLRLRLAIGTEAMVPHVLEAEYRQPAGLERDASALAERTFAAFPAHVHDHLTSNDYLRDAGRALLRRQLARIAHGAL